jgi:hypothetical protein
LRFAVKSLKCRYAQKEGPKSGRGRQSERLRERLKKGREKERENERERGSRIQESARGLV